MSLMYARYVYAAPVIKIIIFIRIIFIHIIL